MTSVLPKFEVKWREECPVGDDILGGLDRYLNEGIVPGGFLTACLENNLKEAFGRADADNGSNMKNIVAYLYNYVPAQAWGSVERVNEWQNKIRGAKRGEAIEVTMTQAQHTPGPYGSFDKVAPDAATNFPCTVITAPNGCPLAYVGNHADYKVNARLFIAAPDLLEALEYCLKQCVASGHVSNEPHIIKGRRAIAKALRAIEE